MNNNMILSDNNTMLLDIHRHALASQDDTDSRHRPVSLTTHYAPNQKC